VAMADRFRSRLSGISLSDPNEGKADGESGLDATFPLSLAMDGAKKVLMTHQQISLLLENWKMHFEFQTATRMGCNYSVPRTASFSPAVPWSLRRVLLQITELTVPSHDLGSGAMFWLEKRRPMSGESRDVNVSSSFDLDPASECICRLP